MVRSVKCNSNKIAETLQVWLEDLLGDIAPLVFFFFFFFCSLKFLFLIDNKFPVLFQFGF